MVKKRKPRYYSKESQKITQPFQPALDFYFHFKHREENKFSEISFIGEESVKETRRKRNKISF